MKSFDVPVHYRSSFLTAIKLKRKAADKMKKDFTPTVLNLEKVQFVIARHFGFCYGVENAIEIAFRAVKENPGKRVFLLSEMIHNPGVNQDLLDLGVQFIMDTSGNMLLDWDSLTADDIVIIPAFGTTLELQERLSQIGIAVQQYETTCPFVEKVWNRAEKIGKDGYSIVVHGKPRHEETRATFSHSRAVTPTVIVKDLAQAQLLAHYIKGEKDAASFYEDFKGQYSEGFDVNKDLKKIGVVNQTTMLAEETQEIADYLKQEMVHHYGLSTENTNLHFADTRDTLCYATNDNQNAVKGLLETDADMALVIGGYNSSNTSHLVELCEQKLPTYFIENEFCLENAGTIQHFDLHQHKIVISHNYIPQNKKPKILVTSGASCPDALVERVIERMAALLNATQELETAKADWL